ncbi:lactate utilization protein [Pseudodesulfovibrio thermohalotolerans]|uniref:lactate utilization protein n=1 Tax=Pseudodesulfovibrio thermohalotolerans TaxID=2880651 RepID=UPI0022B9D640|nr:lactate utilization protein [Pseudodesulfovibrio thermohalotolerans]WFS63524.1 lactate utilization protein [Pseudodesulfovibrio thermohalotolerans]
MDKTMDNYWSLNLADLREQLENNGFDVYMAATLDDARTIVIDEMLPALAPKTVSWGGSVTLAASGLYDYLRDCPDFEALDTWDKALSLEEKYELRRKALLVDCFFAGTNAVTRDGRLVNLDMYGNRTGAITFGPRNVVLLVGRNKVVPDLERAMERVKEYVAPVNTMRLKMKTPCVKTGYCMDCSSPDRICNVWTITEKSFPKGRIKIVLINSDEGF